jgi:hypothetical protein
MSTNGNGKQLLKTNSDERLNGKEEDEEDDREPITEDEKNAAKERAAGNPIDGDGVIYESTRAFWECEQKEVEACIRNFQACTTPSTKVSAVCEFLARARETPYTTQKAKEWIQQIETLKILALSGTSLSSSVTLPLTGAPTAGDVSEQRNFELMLHALSAEDQQLCASFEGEQKKQFVSSLYKKIVELKEERKRSEMELKEERKRSEMELKTSAMNALMWKFHGYLSEVILAASDVTNLLRALAGLSEAEGSGGNYIP